MIHVTIGQLDCELSTWLKLVGQGETVAITHQGRIVAHLNPPDDAPAPATKRSMGDFLEEQDQRMQRTFGNRIVADSAAVLSNQRTDR